MYLTYNAGVRLSSELEASLREFAAAGPAELREDGGRVAPLSTLSSESWRRGLCVVLRQ